MTARTATVDTDRRSDIRAQIAASISAKQALAADDALLRQIESLAQRCLDALRAGGKVVFAGNGGSFADAQHLSAEFTSRFMTVRAPLASIVLGTNSCAMTAIGNDYGFDQVFARELQAVATPQDVFIPISTSGNSPNILTAAVAARAAGIAIVALTGRTGGKLAAVCDCIRVPSSETARIQECHELIGHIVCGIVEKDYFSK